MKRLVFAIAVSIATVPGAALSQGSATQQEQPQLGAPVPPEYLKPLPEIKGVVSWTTLSQVQSVKVKDRVVPQFADSVLKLNATEVKLQGFIMPLEMGEKQKHFVLTAMPQTCAFCLPGGPEALVEVRAKTPVKYTFEPVVLTGKLAVLKDDPNGLYYRLTDAVPTTAK
jgi:uncharacterized protein